MDLGAVRGDQAECVRIGRGNWNSGELLRIGPWWPQWHLRPLVLPMALMDPVASYGQDGPKVPESPSMAYKPAKGLLTSQQAERLIWFSKALWLTAPFVP